MGDSEPDKLYTCSNFRALVLQGGQGSRENIVVHAV